MSLTIGKIGLPLELIKSHPCLAFSAYMAAYSSDFILECFREGVNHIFIDVSQIQIANMVEYMTIMKEKF
jgi:hypothetical protein